MIDKQQRREVRLRDASKDTTVNINVIDEQLKSIENTYPIVFKDPLVHENEKLLEELKQKEQEMLNLKERWRIREEELEEKALIDIVPKEGISFVSTLYGGSISDKEITQRSVLLEKLQPGDAIMADRGFNIQEMFASKCVRVNVLPIMNDSGQFEEHELLETRRIASLRIHVERAIERIKNYHILDSIPITLRRNGIIDMIFFVCAMLTNSLPPFYRIRKTTAYNSCGGTSSFARFVHLFTCQVLPLFKKFVIPSSLDVACNPILKKGYIDIKVL
ncbi:hypothetical protein AWC38_SpisGene21831 [Stylophora pistillata]|uniref:DDE Tnp4 domain-containing protein n=1 Tax=Stylophora pistillata TaxID=50429 RepID=A0A2B4R6R4_STYPI|nr:hypothetical protein AWC38_SpisGene21831 [Stylophora pistillata]